MMATDHLTLVSERRLRELVALEQVGGVPERAEWMETVRILREQRDAALRLAEEREQQIAALRSALRPLAESRHAIERYADMSGEPSDWTVHTIVRVGDIDRATVLLAAAPPAGEATGRAEGDDNDKEA